ncbi:MAG: PAS domain S-box protein [Caldilineaceae bacterium]|nr:PAS domain S-box protein [Caldilineaceae bacterium]
METNGLDSSTRLHALEETGLLDSKSERAFDRLTELARRLLHVPVALVSLVTDERQFFKSSAGLAEPWATQRQTPLSHSFCQHVVTGDAPLCINNAHEDPLVADNRAITDLDVVAYLGVPLHTPEDEVIGSLCVIDAKPRQWSNEELTTLTDLAAIVESEIALRVHLAQRTEAEYALQQSEQRLRSVIDNLFSFVGLMTPDGTLIEANQTALQAASLQPEDVLGKPFVDTYWWSYSPAIQAQLRDAIARVAQGESLRYDVPVRLGDDHYIEIDFMLAPIFDEEGNVSHLVPSGLDITQRKATEAALRASEASFRSTFENAAVGIAHVGLDGTWLRVNQRLCEIVGYTAEELFKQTFQEITHPADLTNDLQHMHALLRQEIDRYQMEKRYFHKDGSVVWVNLTVTVQHDEEGQAHHFISIIEDISARKTAEERLTLLAKASAILASSIEYTDNLQQVAQFIVTTFADWCVAELVTQGSNNGTAPTPVLQPIALAHKEDENFARLATVRPQVVSQLQTHRGRGKVLATGESILIAHLTDDDLVKAARSQEHLTILREVQSASTMILPLRIRGVTVGTFTLVRTQASRPYDETDLHFAEELADRIALAIDNLQLYRDARRAEAGLRALNETLEQQVTDRTEELQLRNQELDHFTYVASHDLRAPLRAIDNLATWIAEDAGHLLPDDSLAHLDKLRDRAARMDKLLTDLLAYSRADRYKGEPEWVDTDQLVRNIGELLVAPPFVLRIPQPLPTLFTLAVPLETVLLNLIANAIKHHHRADGTITLTAQQAADMVEFAVQDDGPGIAPIYHTRIFEIYKTLQPRDKVEGSGIGLSIVKKIVESQGGEIRIESAEGAGATFRFTWPNQPQSPMNS